LKQLIAGAESLRETLFNTPSLCPDHMMDKLRSFVVLAAVALGAGAVEAQEFPEGEKIYQKVCRNCHGPKARGVGSFPKLVGFSAEYLADRLKQYRAGETVGPNSALMKPVSVKLSDEEIQDLAGYVANTFP